MPNDNGHELNLDGLLNFLRRVGFEQVAKVNRSLAYHHPCTGTIIALSIPEDGRSVRSADLLSVLMRLESAGLVDDSQLKQFKSGKLPMAS